MPEAEIIFLLGMPGCGKSVAGKLLSDKMSTSFIDLDILIQNKEGKNIREIFQQHGEEYFREKESFYLKNLPLDNAVVISLGGGTPCFHDNMNWIKEHGKSYYLKMPAEVLASRIQNRNAERPLLKNLQNENLIKKLLEVANHRESFYSLADFTIACENDSPETLTEKIFQLR